MAGCTHDPHRSADVPDAELFFAISEGRSDNYFIRQGGVSAHLSLQSAPAPRIVVAFPAGNSGAMLRFSNVDGATAWGAVRDVSIIEARDAAGLVLRGIRADIDVGVDRLVLLDADVGSIRFLRKAVDAPTLARRAEAARQVDGERLQISRERPDGQSSYLAEVQVLTGDSPEAPFPTSRLTNANAVDNEMLANALAFLTCDTKMLAGSWRFLTYFGRDTLLAIQLLMPVLTAETAEIGLGSVLDRINEHGEVAHEEEIGELAVYRNLAHSGRPTAEPRYDYAMVDDNLLLAPVLAHFLDTFGVSRTKNLLSRRSLTSETFRGRLARNLRLVSGQALAFADDPDPSNLVAIKNGFDYGNWRDSREGLAGGRYPYDVNAVLMPAALAAAARIVDAGLLDDDAATLPSAGRLRQMAAAWQTHAAGHFNVTIAATHAREKLAGYANDNGYPPVDLPDRDLHFKAVALDRRFAPIPVMHSDIGMDLLLLDRPAGELAQIVDTLVRPFPVGLSTPIGVVAANPAFANAEMRTLLTSNHYHGVVVWSWQQAMIAAGLDRQLRRNDLPAALRTSLSNAAHDIGAQVKSSKTIIGSELWSFVVRDGQYVIAPFGQSAGHLTESNPVQLWSTVFLVPPQLHGR